MVCLIVYIILLAAFPPPLLFQFHPLLLESLLLSGQLFLFFRAALEKRLDGPGGQNFSLFIYHRSICLFLRRKGRRTLNCHFCLLLSSRTQTSRHLLWTLKQLGTSASSRTPSLAKDLVLPRSLIRKRALLNSNRIRW